MMVAVGILVAITAGAVALAVDAVRRNRRLERNISRDTLTGVGNRHGFDQFVASLGQQPHLAIAVIDFDRFKQLNDRHGHMAGDAALVRVARALDEQSAAIYGDKARVYRLGGDEFMIVLEGADSLHAAAAIERIRHGVSDVLEQHEKLLTISCGIACSPEHSTQVVELVGYADRALYQAKRAGRARTVVYTSTMFDRDDERASRKMLRTLAEALAAAVDAKDSYTHAHSHNVADLAMYLAQAMGMGKEQVDDIALGGLLHDIGKIGVVDRVLNKPGQLDADEWKQIQSHTEIGYEILSGLDGAEHIREMVLYHHERLDGSGYPRGLRGSEIPMAARIIAVADVFDSITAERIHQPARTPEEAMSEIIRLRGVQFDEAVVDAFCELMVYDLDEQGVNAFDVDVDDGFGSRERRAA